MLKCGIYEHDITPPLGSQIPGYFNVRLADGIKERLYAEAVVFAQDDKIVSVIVACDVIGVPNDINNRARAEIAEKLNVDEGAVTVHATHVHTGGPVLNFVCTRDDAYCEFLGDKIVEAAILAVKQLRDVKIGFGHDYDYTIANYRDRVLPDGTLSTNNGTPGNKPFGKIDPEVSCIIIKNAADNTPYGVIVNYACHTDCVGGTEFSSDFPGAMRDTLRLTYGADFMPVFLNGFFGNLNHIDFENRKHAVPNYYRSMGRKLAGRVISAMEDRDAVWFDEPEIKAEARRITVKHRMPTEWELNWATEALERDKTTPLAVNDKHFAQNIMKVQSLGERTYELCVQVQKIGGINLFACPREMFVEFEYMLKEGSDSDMNLCACNSNGDCGYVQIKELITPSIYESRLDTGKLEPDAGYIMVDTMLDIMKNL